MRDDLSVHTYALAHKHKTHSNLNYGCKLGGGGRRRRGLVATEMEEPDWSILLEIFLPPLSSQLSCSLQAIKGSLSLLLCPHSLSFFHLFLSHTPPPPPACGSVSRFFSILSLAANSVFPIFFSFSKLRSSARKINVAKTSVTVLSTRLNDFINCICQGTAYCHVPQRRMYLAPN